MKTPEPASKKEYRAYADKLKRVMRAELKKPKSIRDEGLIDECEKSIKYCTDRQKELGSTNGQERISLNAKPLRWVAAAAAVIFLLFGTSIVSYSFGRKALSDRVQWRVRHFKTEKYGIVDFDEDEILRDDFEVRTFDSEEELRAAYGEDLLLPGSFTGVYFVSAEVRGEPGNALIRCEYRVNKKPLILEIDCFDEELFDDGPSQILPEPYSDESLPIITESGLYYPDDFRLSHCGEMIVGSSTDISFVYFPNRDDHYILTGGQGTEILADIAERMIKMRKDD